MRRGSSSSLFVGAKRKTKRSFPVFFCVFSLLINLGGKQDARYPFPPVFSAIIKLALFSQRWPYVATQPEAIWENGEKFFPLPSFVWKTTTNHLFFFFFHVDFRRVYNCKKKKRVRKRKSVVVIPMKKWLLLLLRGWRNVDEEKEGGEEKKIGGWRKRRLLLNKDTWKAPPQKMPKTIYSSPNILSLSLNPSLSRENNPNSKKMNFLGNRK